MPLPALQENNQRTTNALSSIAEVLTQQQEQSQSSMLRTTEDDRETATITRLTAQQRRERAADESEKEAREALTENPLVPLMKELIKVSTDSHKILGDIYQRLETMALETAKGMDSSSMGTGGLFAGLLSSLVPKIGKTVKGAIKKIGTAAVAGAKFIAPIAIASAKTIGAGIMTAMRTFGPVLGGIAKAIPGVATIAEAGLTVYRNYEELAKTGEIDPGQMVAKSVEGIKQIFSADATIQERLKGAYDVFSGLVGTVVGVVTKMTNFVRNLVPENWMDTVTEGITTGFGLWGDTRSDIKKDAEDRVAAIVAKSKRQWREQQEAEKNLEESKKEFIKTETERKNVEKDIEKEKLAKTKNITSNQQTKIGEKPGELKITQPDNKPIPAILTDENGKPLIDNSGLSKSPLTEQQPIMIPTPDGGEVPAQELTEEQSRLMQAFEAMANTIIPAANAAPVQQTELFSGLTQTSVPSELNIPTPIQAAGPMPSVGELKNLKGTEKGVAVAQHLAQSGFSPAQASGIVGNIMAETGKFKHFQEISPIAGRGGAGWLQWTGKRRRNFEAWAKEQGLDPRTDEANMGFLMHEMRGGTGDHWTKKGMKIGGQRATKNYSLEEFLTIEDPQEAARYFMEGYERPGILHQSKREGYGVQIAQQLGLSPEEMRERTKPLTSISPLQAREPSAHDKVTGTMQRMGEMVFGDRLMELTGDMLQGASNISASGMEALLTGGVSAGAAYNPADTSRRGDGSKYKSRRQSELQQAFRGSTMRGFEIPKPELISPQLSRGLMPGDESGRIMSDVQTAGQVLTGVMPDGFSKALETSTLAIEAVKNQTQQIPEIPPINVQKTIPGSSRSGAIETPLIVQNTESSIRRLTDQLMGFSFG